MPVFVFLKIEQREDAFQEPKQEQAEYEDTCSVRSRNVLEEGDHGCWLFICPFPAWRLGLLLN